jgi:outer membrane protein insertion porin family
MSPDFVRHLPTRQRVLSMLALLVLPIQLAWAQAEPFAIADIRVEGLQRISPGSVFAALPSV